MTLRNAALASVLLASLLAGSCGGDPGGGISLAVNEEEIDREPGPFEHFWWDAVSPDGRRIVRENHDGGHTQLMVNGKLGKVYDDIEKPEFSPDGRLVFIAQRGSKRFVVVDGKEGEKFDSAYGPVFSPTGKRMAFAADAGGKSFVVVDGVKSAAPSGPLGNLTFSSDEHHLAYSVDQGDSCTIVVDGKAYPVQAWVVSLLRISPNGKRFAANVLPGSPEQLMRAPKDTMRKAALMVDGVLGKEYDAVWRDVPAVRAFSWSGGMEGPIFSLDSKHMVYVGRRRGKDVLVTDGKEGLDFDEVRAPTFSPDGTRFGFTARRGRAWVAVIDGKERPAHDGAGLLTFSPDGKARRLRREGGRNPEPDCR